VRGVSGNVSFTVIIFLIQTFTLFFLSHLVSVLKPQKIALGIVGDEDA